MKHAHIDAIRRQLGVSLAAVHKFNSEHKDEIEHISDIFNLKGNNKEKVLALLYMFSTDEEDDVIQKYRDQTGLDNAKYNKLSIIEQYKNLLLTALIYNQVFYVAAVNYREFISAGLAVKEVERNSFVTPRNWGGIVQKNEENRQGNIIPFSKSRQTVPDAIAAASKDIGNGNSDVSFE